MSPKMNTQIEVVWLMHLGLQEESKGGPWIFNLWMNQFNMGQSFKLQIDLMERERVEKGVCSVAKKK